jgi:hypothetical protein
VAKARVLVADRLRVARPLLLDLGPVRPDHCPRLCAGRSRSRQTDTRALR